MQLGIIQKLVEQFLRNCECFNFLPLIDDPILDRWRHVPLEGLV
jgi:hypothetical protein